MSSSLVSDVPFEDLNARARIREAALRHFAEEGYQRATIRSIAQTAEVSPGLLRHHYGSKESLRQACDEYVFETLRRLNTQFIDDPGVAAANRGAAQRFGRYVARSLADGSATAGPAFDELVTATEQWLTRADQARADPPDDAPADPPAVSLRIRAALVTAMAMGIPLLHEHVSRALGYDMFSAEGDRLLALGLLDIYSHTLLDAQTAATVRAGLGQDADLGGR
jgi:TetR/AcrR family transcriptional regulator, regulator of cefoperazone and chloramphenicol sensitivity